MENIEWSRMSFWEKVVSGPMILAGAVCGLASIVILAGVVIYGIILLFT